MITVVYNSGICIQWPLSRFVHEHKRMHMQWKVLKSDVAENSIFHDTYEYRCMHYISICDVIYRFSQAYKWSSWLITEQ